MSQQINLLLPALRPRFDWLALPLVGGAVLATLLLIVALSSVTALQVQALRARESALKTELRGLQQQIQTLGQSLTARKGDASLDKRLGETRLALVQRQEVLSAVAQGRIPGGAGYSGLLRGFSRQMLDGVWLTGFGFEGQEVEIRGRLLDPARLPVYMNRLNGEPAFAGRRFATLDMTGVSPAPATEVQGNAPAGSGQKTARYTEFVLRTGAEKSQ